MSLRRFALPVLIWSIAISSAAAAATTDSSISSIPNFHQVDPRVFRGGQPLDSAWPDLAKLGVKTVIDLRQVSEHSTTAEAQAVKAAGMHYVNFPWDGFQTPRGEQIARVLQAMNGDGAVFVHCKQGRDRTGTAIAAYRISRDGWTNQKALSEAKTYGMHWFERGMMRFITDYRASESTPIQLASTGTSTPVDTLQSQSVTP